MQPALEAGYQIHEAVFSAEDVGRLIHDIDAQAIPYSRAGARHVLGYPPIAAVARDARLTNIASAWLGAPALPFKATLFNKNPAANWLVAWHQDTALPLSARIASPGWGAVVAEGSVIAMRPLIIHASSKSISGKPRRVLHVEYAASMEIAPGMKLQVA
jgi:hypothetical protein